MKGPLFWWALDALSALNPLGGATSGSRIKPPIAATWIYMADDQNYTTIPPKWSSIDFKPVDLLFVGPVGVQSDGTFGLYESESSGPLENRFKWVLETARNQNPDIKIIASQWWGNGTGIWGDVINTLETNRSVEVYVDSVGKFVERWNVDGYDIDYETGNLREDFAVFAKQIRHSLDETTQASGRQPYYFTISPVTTFFLEDTAPYIDYVSLQTYAGGMELLSIGDFFNLGMKPEQLLFGMCAETGCSTPDFETVQKKYSSLKLGGIHMWRLNSVNLEEEAKVQADIYAFLHPQK